MLASKQALAVGLAPRWGWVVARGMFGVLFGLIAFVRPGVTFGMVLFGCYAFASGIAMVIASARPGRAGGSWGTLLLEGLLGIAIGALAVLWPETIVLNPELLIGCWAIVMGVLELASVVRLRKIFEREWAVWIAGALSMAFGVFVFGGPIGDGSAVPLLRLYALFVGIPMIVFGFQLRSFARRDQRSELPSEGLRQT